MRHRNARFRISTERIRVGSLWLLLGAMIIGMLFVGLYPFDFRQKNEASINAKPGYLRFRIPSIAKLSPLPPQLVHSAGGPFTLQMRLRSTTEANHSVPEIVAFYDRRQEILVIGQWKSTAVFLFYDRTPTPVDKLGTPPVFRSDTPVDLTLTSGAGGTVLYVNGKESRHWAYRVDDGALARADGVVLGNSANGTQPWTGEVYSLRFFDRTMTADEVAASYEHTVEVAGSHPTRIADPSEVLNINFNRVPFVAAPASVGPVAQLDIPRRFHSPHLEAFMLPWVDVTLNASYVSDLIINLLGFIPLGFVLGVILLMKRKPARRALGASAALAGSLSFAIEFLQIFLPTRTSQLSDFLLNLAGGILGTYLAFRNVSIDRSRSRTADASIQADRP